MSQNKITITLSIEDAQKLKHVFAEVAATNLPREVILIAPTGKETTAYIISNNYSGAENRDPIIQPESENKATVQNLTPNSESFRIEFTC